MKAYRAIIHTTLFTLLSVGCASILGIEDAELANDDAGSGGSNGNGGSAGSTGAEASCEAYCDTVMENCTGERAVYSGLQNCLDLCGTLPVGDPEDPEGNTVACRLAEATAAGEDPEEHCPVAGLGGAEVCGENCPAFCGAMLEICPGKYPSNAACLDDCDSLDDLGGFKLADQGGSTVQCRIYHVNAATELTDPHCSHAAGEALCVP